MVTAVIIRLGVSCKWHDSTSVFLNNLIQIFKLCGSIWLFVNIETDKIILPKIKWWNEICYIYNTFSIYVPEIYC